MSYRYRATETFWNNFYDLSPEKKETTRKAWQIFKEDPFDSRLGTHKIHRLSALMRRTVYAVVVEADLRVVFYIDGEVVVSFNIGSHDVYRA
jgi:hypothetical protein